MTSQPRNAAYPPGLAARGDFLGLSCAACGAVIEGAGIVERLRAVHPWCWMTERSAAAHPGLYAVARDLAAREQHAGA